MTHVAKDSPRAGLRWFPLNIGTALVLATAISLLAFMLLSDGEGQAAAEPSQTIADVVEVAAGPSSPAVEPAAPPTTIAHAEAVTESRAASRDLGGGDATAETTILGPEEAQGLITPVVVATSASEFGTGPTEVALVTNFPAANYSWDRVELEGSGYFDLNWIGELNGNLAAVSAGWNEAGFDVEGGSQTLVTWAASDASEWERIGETELPAETWISRVIGWEDRLYAIAEQMPEEGRSASYIILSSTDGVSWSTDDLPVGSAEGDEYVYLQDAVAGPRGIALMVQYESYPPEPPQQLVFEEFEVEIDHMKGEYTLTDVASGDVVLSGPIEDIYNWSEADGQRIIDPATGEELTVVPWDVWEMAYVGVYEGEYGGSPLPIPIHYEETYQPPVVTIEYDGYIITIDEGVGRFEVADATSGGEIAQGTLEELFQGPPPRLVDPETGDVVFTVSWEEWHRAEEKAWETHDYSDAEFEYSSRTAVLVSADGETWSEEMLTDGSNGSSGFIAPSADGFIVIVTTYGDLGEQRTIWQYADGVWSSTPGEQSQLWLYNITHIDDGFFAVGDGATGQAVWSSADGLSWATEFTAAPQSDGAYVWLSAVASDGQGLVGVIASHETMYEYKPLVIEQELYTATFEQEEAVVHITETGSGTTVLLLTWEDFEFESASSAVTRDGETTVFALDNGDTMVITDEEANAAMESRYLEEAPVVGASVFLRSGGSWSEAVVDPGGGFSGASQLFMSEGKIIVSGSYWGGYPYDAETADDGAFILIGTPAGG